MNNPLAPKKSIRREYRHPAGKFKSGKLVPVMAVPVLPNESGLLEQTINLELAPIAGRMISDIYAEVTCIYVPIQAMDKLFNDADENAGITEILRRKIMDGTSIFGLEAENEITKRLAINPKSYSGTKKVSAIARLAYNASVNYLRKRRYIYADVLTKANTSVVPAIISETTLDRFNAALDPDEHINGNVKLRLSETEAPVTGIYQDQLGNHTPDAVTGEMTDNLIKLRVGTTGHAINFIRKQNPQGLDLKVTALLADVQAEGFSLVDLYNAEMADRIVRQMRKIAEDHPQDGEDAILRFAFGLQTEANQHPFVLFNRRGSLLDFRRNAMDAQGLQDEVTMSYLMQSVDFSIPVPATELGGVIVTLIQVTPDEIIDSQPHPILSEDWGYINHAAEQLKLEPESVILRDMYSDITMPDDETNLCFYVGHNELKRNYLDYGFNRQVDPETVEAKTVMWQFAIPSGVTPSNILYPEEFPQYPFADHFAEVITYDITSKMIFATPMFFGPSPVEKLDIVTDENLLGEQL